MTALAPQCQPNMDSADDSEMYAIRDLIASHIACEAECKAMPTGCGCALVAARDIAKRHRAKVDELTAALRPDTIKKAIDAAFSEKGLWIDWQLRDAVVSKVVALTHSVNSQHSDGEAGR